MPDRCALERENVRITTMIAPQQTRHVAFTLIELLVVISIVALLIALLLPAIKRFRERTRIVACASNLHQNGLWIMVYAQNHQAKLPPYPGGAMKPQALRGDVAREISERYGVSEQAFYCPSHARFSDRQVQTQYWDSYPGEVFIGYMNLMNIPNNRGLAGHLRATRWPAGTRPSPERCEPAGRRRPAPDGSMSFPRLPGTARAR